MKRVSALLVLVSLAGCETVTQQPDFETEIRSYGIMEEREEPPEDDDSNPVPVSLELEIDFTRPGDDMGRVVAEDNRLVVVRQTDYIPYEPGTIFGFSWCSTGHPDGLTPLDILIEAPLVADGVSAGRQKFKQVWALGQVVDGTICRTESHLLSDDDEITPGVWVFSILMNRRIIATKEFTVGS